MNSALEEKGHFQFCVASSIFKELFEILWWWLLDLLKKGENYRNWVQQQEEWHAAAAATAANPTTAIEEIAWLLHQEKKSASMSFFSSKEARAKDKSVCVESIGKGQRLYFLHLPLESVPFNPFFISQHRAFTYLIFLLLSFCFEKFVNPCPISKHLFWKITEQFVYPYR